MLIHDSWRPVYSRIVVRSYSGLSVVAYVDFKDSDNDAPQLEEDENLKNAAWSPHNLV